MHKKYKLQLLQQEFASAILAAERWSIVNELHASASLNSRQRLGIYKHNYLLTMSQALMSTYPVCVKLVGEAFFRMLAKAYIQQTPSTSFSLNDYGNRLAEFIAEFAPAASVPYLADTARLEWACHRASLNANKTSFDYQALTAVAESEREQIRFQLPQGASLIQSSFPILTIWQLGQDNNAPVTPIDLNQLPGEQVIVFQQELDLRMDLLTDWQWQLLTAIRGGICFGDLCVQFSDAITEQLPILIAQGWIKGFH